MGDLSWPQKAIVGVLFLAGLLLAMSALVHLFYRSTELPAGQVNSHANITVAPSDDRSASEMLEPQISSAPSSSGIDSSNLQPNSAPSSTTTTSSSSSSPLATLISSTTSDIAEPMSGSKAGPPQQSDVELRSEGLQTSTMKPVEILNSSSPRADLSSSHVPEDTSKPEVSPTIASSQDLPETTTSTEKGLSLPTISDVSNRIASSDPPATSLPTSHPPELPVATLLLEPEELRPPGPNPTKEELDSWFNFRRIFQKQYPNGEEEAKRRGLFVLNYRFVNQFNERSDALFKLAINSFADMSRDEINRLFVGPQVAWADTLRRAGQLPAALEIAAEAQPAAEHQVDWRNLTTGIVNQGLCLDSSVFATVASIEAAYSAAHATGNDATGVAGNELPYIPVKFAESQLLDCAAASILDGRATPPCTGSLSMVDAFELMQRRPAGLTPPGTARPGCGQADESAGSVPRARLASYSLVRKENMLEALINSGPLVVALDASQSTFHFYSEGIYHDLNCSLDNYNMHALLVGNQPALQPNQEAYLIIRSSLGSHWGNRGHINLLRNEQRNKCIPQHLAVYPNLA